MGRKLVMYIDFHADLISNSAILFGVHHVYVHFFSIAPQKLQIVFSYQKYRLKLFVLFKLRLIIK